MDAMALLCNLHADGPATLRRLRAFGVGTLQDLHDREVAELARLLEVSPAQARRFVREADQLRERLGPDAWDTEEGEEVAPAFDGNTEGLESLPPEPRTVPIPEGVRERPSARAPRQTPAAFNGSPRVSSTSESPGASSASLPAAASSVEPTASFSEPASYSEPVTSSTTPASSPLDSARNDSRSDSEARPTGAVQAGGSNDNAESAEASAGRLSERDRELLDQVLRRWRGGAKPQANAAGANPSDEIQPRQAPLESAPAARPQDHLQRAVSTQHESNLPQANLPQSMPPADLLTAGRVSGLGIPQIEKLELAGVRTFTALATCDPLALSKTSGLAFSTLQRLKFLAGRAPASNSASENPERLSHSERPPMNGAAHEPSVGTLMEALSPRQPRPSAPSPAPVGSTGSYRAGESLSGSLSGQDEEPSLADLLPHEDEGPGGPFA